MVEYMYTLFLNVLWHAVKIIVGYKGFYIVGPELKSGSKKYDKNDAPADRKRLKYNVVKYSNGLLQKLIFISISICKIHHMAKCRFISFKSNIAYHVYVFVFVPLLFF